MPSTISYAATNHQQRASNPYAQPIRAGKIHGDPTGHNLIDFEKWSNI